MPTHSATDYRAPASDLHQASLIDIHKLIRAYQHLAIRFPRRLARLEVVQVLLDHNADTNSLDENGQTPLHLTVSKSNHSEGKVTTAVRLLLEQGADPNTHDLKHSTPLHAASWWGWLEVARVLLSHGANVDEKDGEGKTPFQLASSRGHVEMAKWLSDHGAQPEQ